MFEFRYQHKQWIIFGNNQHWLLTACEIPMLYQERSSKPSQVQVGDVSCVIVSFWLPVSHYHLLALRSHQLQIMDTISYHFSRDAASHCRCISDPLVKVGPQQWLMLLGAYWVLHETDTTQRSQWLLCPHSKITKTLVSNKLHWASSGMNTVVGMYSQAFFYAIPSFDHNRNWWQIWGIAVSPRVSHAVPYGTSAWIHTLYLFWNFPRPFLLKPNYFRGLAVVLTMLLSSSTSGDHASCSTSQWWHWVGFTWWTFLESIYYMICVYMYVIYIR